jgi:hypothetical protein
MSVTGATGPDSDAVAGLAREIEALHRRVDELARTGKRLDELGALVTRLAQVTGPNKNAPSQVAPSWLDLDAPGQPGAAEEILGMLGGWVARVYLRYSDARLPDCWLWHPELVEELLWLHAAWLAAYDPDASVAAVGDWHDRQRPGVVARIHKYAGLCSLEAHRPGQERHMPAPAAPTTDAVPAIASWWATRRIDPAPAPTDEQLAAATARMTRSRR